MDNMETVANWLQDNVDWTKFWVSIKTLGTVYDSPSYRFIKGQLITEALAKYSNERVPFVDGIGYDNIITDLEETLIEVRSEKEAIGKKGSIRSGLKLKNGRGETTEFSPPDNWFLLVVRTTAPFIAVLVDADTAFEYATHKGNEVTMGPGCQDYKVINKCEDVQAKKVVKKVNVARMMLDSIDGESIDDDI